MPLFLSSLLLAGAAMGAPLQPSDPVFPNATITTPLNGTIPSPLQPGIVSNCDDFYFVKPGDICVDIASAKDITLDEFLAWNPQAGDTYACISVTGHTPTPTKPSNGIETPKPIQDGMVGNCNKFHFVKSGESCPAIQKGYGVSLEDLAKWNPAIKDDCTLMWANTNLYVGVVA